MSTVADPHQLHERTFLAEGSVLVTNARFVAGGQTYSIAGVTSVKVVLENSNSGLAILCIIAGAIMLLLGFTPLQPKMLLIGAGALGLGVLIVRSQKATHHLVPTSQVLLTST